jgi:D-sedoheptulose 7-phosphate isomerase
MANSAKAYLELLQKSLKEVNISSVEEFVQAMADVWDRGSQVFLCGNGGSAANCCHVANDLLYGVSSGTSRLGLRVDALPANPAILTCLGNDVGYEYIFSEQLRTKGEKGDILVVFSGSGNSENICNALIAAKEMGLKTFAVLGYDGGRALSLADVTIHTPVDDMQISEDLQLVIGHICMKMLNHVAIVEFKTRPFKVS